MSSADQNNKNMKVKYITKDNYEAPLFRNICEFENSGMMYGADGQLTKQKMKTSTTYTKNGKQDVYDQDLYDDNFDSRFFPNLNAKKQSNVFNDDEVTEDESNAYHCDKINAKNANNQHIRCKEKSRYIEYSYVPGGSMQNGGFGNLDRFSDLKQGIDTRNKHETVSDIAIDDYTFHHTFVNYESASLGSNPLPENTRYANKKYIN